jgi:FkbM family methyltransferase
MESNQQNLIRHVNFEPEYIIEVGSRDGNESKWFKLTYPKASVYAFECNPETILRCHNRSYEYGFHVIESAVSDKDGFRYFYQIDTQKTTTSHADGNPGASSLLKATGKYPPEQYVQNRIKVKTTRLDTFMAERGIPRIDILWMDAQGSELMVLKGLGKRINDVKMIHTEVEFFPIYERQPLFGDMDKFLKSKGFKFVTFTSRDTYAADALYIHD